MTRRLVFVSHSKEDTWIARKIADCVRASGADVFLDHDHIEIGADFEKEILVFLRDAHELILLLTPWALSSQYVSLELGAAWVRDIPIIVILLGLSPSDLKDHPVALNKRKMISLNDADVYFAELAARVDDQRLASEA